MIKNILITLFALCLIVSITTGCENQGSPGKNSDEVTGQTSISDNASSEKSTNGSEDQGTDNIEQYIFDTFKGPETNSEDAEKILAVLGKIDWKKYDRISHEKAFELTDWLYTIKIESEDDILSVLNAINGLDGAIAEGYSGIVAKIFTGDSKKFIKCLSRIDDGKIKDIYSYLAYGCSSNNEKYKKVLSDTKELLDSNQVKDEEKEITENILKAFDSISK